MTLNIEKKWTQEYLYQYISSFHYDVIIFVYVYDKSDIYIKKRNLHGLRMLDFGKTEMHSSQEGFYEKGKKLVLGTRETITTLRNIDELEYLSYKIETMEIGVTLGNEYDSNRITMVFDNSEQATTEIKFGFNSGDDYLLLKNKIELCLKNFRLNYRVLSAIPIMPILLTVTFIMICVHTGKRDIVFPTMVQRLIVGIWLGGGFLICILPHFARLKRNLFPCTEFRVGQNELVEKKNESIRNFLIGTDAIGTVLGVLENYINDFLF